MTKNPSGTHSTATAGIKLGALAFGHGTTKGKEEATAHAGTDWGAGTERERGAVGGRSGSESVACASVGRDGSETARIRGSHISGGGTAAGRRGSTAPASAAGKGSRATGGL